MSNPLAFLWSGPFFDKFKHTEAPWVYFTRLDVALIGSTLYVLSVMAYKAWIEPKEPPKAAPKEAATNGKATNEATPNGKKKEGGAGDKKKLPFWFKPLSVGHNAFLAVLSLVMFIGGWLECLRQCASYDSALGFWFVVFAASKYIEFVDTYLMMVKSYNIILLHWWHHATVPVLCCFHIIEGSSAAWTGSIFNCFVHTVMYAYYASAAAGGRCSAKELVTALQLLQFVTVLGHVGWLCYTNGFWAHPWTVGLSYSVYASYLILFIQFFLETYVWKTAKGAVKKKKEA